MDILFFVFMIGLTILVVKLKYGLTGKSFKFYCCFLILMIGPILTYILLNLIQNDFLRAFLWIPPAIILCFLIFWFVKYLENNKKSEP
jgi:hypothetical protein